MRTGRALPTKVAKQVLERLYVSMDDVRYGHLGLDYEGNNVNEYCILYKNYAGTQCGVERSVAAHDPYPYGAGGWW